MDTATTATEIHRVLDGIIDPCSVSHGVPMGIDEMGLVRSVEIDDDGHVVVDMRLTSPCCLMVGHFVNETKERVGALPGVRSVELRHDTGMEWTPSMIAPAAEARRQLALRVVRRSA
jgi:metal-sulfur cluster biosynthetic enzyme